MPACAAVNCKSRRDKSSAVSGKTFHQFPHRDRDLLEKWVVAVCRENWQPAKYSVLCSSHFEEKCFDRTGQTVRIREGAIPTLFNFLNKNPIGKSQKKQSTQDAVPEKSLAEISIPTITSAMPILAAHLGHQYSTGPLSLKQELDSGEEDNKEAPCLRLDAIPAKSLAEIAPPKVTLAMPRPAAHVEHHYFNNPQSLMRKLDRQILRNVSIRRVLKVTQQKVRRLQRRVNSMKDIIKTLKEKH